MDPSPDPEEPRQAVDVNALRPDGPRFPPGSHRDGTLDVACWCGGTVVRLAAADVRKGRTKACYREGCERGCAVGELRGKRGKRRRRAP